MAWQYETGSGSARATSNHDLLNKMISMVTGRHVATVAVNAAGTGYVVGEIITLTHTGGAHLDAKFEVLTLSGSAVATMRIVSSGSFGDRVNGTVTITAGGTGYATSASNVVLELQSGTSRMPAKFLATTNGSGVVTSAVLFEDLGSAGGGVYSSLPSYPAATTIQGPAGTAAGTGCTITMGGSTGTVGLTAQATTASASGTGCTVDITLVESGWTVDSRNSNDNTVNSLTNEKTVTLVGDASGITNKPFFTYRTGSFTDGLNERYFIATIGMIAHNPAIDITAHAFISGGHGSESSFVDGGSYITCSEDQSGAGTDDMDFWISVNDQRIIMVTQLDETAATSDNGVYIQHYAGLMNRVGTETESPYPLFIFGSANRTSMVPTSTSNLITGLAENRHALTGCGQYYDTVTPLWRSVTNDDTAGSQEAEADVMLPIGEPFQNASGLDEVSDTGTLPVSNTFFKLDRASATTILRKIPGTTQDEFFLWPLTLQRKPGTAVDSTNDRIHGQLQDVFWISSDDGTGSRIANFSEDFVTIGSDRYTVFHNHVHTEPYQYIAIKVDV